jgi:hypothetical protein
MDAPLVTKRYLAFAAIMFIWSTCMLTTINFKGIQQNAPLMKLEINWALPFLSNAEVSREPVISVCE